MANKKLNLASIPANKLIAELPGKRQHIKKHKFNLDTIFYNLKNVLRNCQNEFDRLQGAKRLTALHPNATSRMKELQNKARQPLKGETPNIYRTKLINCMVYRTWKHIRNETNF